MRLHDNMSRLLLVVDTPGDPAKDAAITRGGAPVIMEIGIFDHVDRSGAPLGKFYDDRFAFVEACDRLGFYSYHIAEHHFTPLGMAASPGIFLSAVAQRAKRLRFGPMVYCLPLYHPLRLAEEICMLDQMSDGRLDVGVGRGISPLESRSYGENPDLAVSRKVYEETLDILLKAMAGGKFSHVGEYRNVQDVEMVLTPAQTPHPPLWMGVQSLENAEFAARRGMNMLSLLSAPALRERVDRFRATWREVHGLAGPRPKIGVGLFIVVGETDAAARQIATRAYKGWHANFHYLYHLHGRSPVWGERPADFSLVESELRGIAGSPDTVRRFIEARVVEADANYVTGQFMFGDMTRSETLLSVELFGREVLPALADLQVAA